MKIRHNLLRLSSLILISAISANAHPSGGALASLTERPKVEVAFVLDTTGSMGGLIEGAKQKIWSIANEIASAPSKPQVKFALIGYRDVGDDYVTKTYDLTDDLDDIYAKLMDFNAGGGGDTPESVNQALHESVNYLTWSDHKDTLRIIFLVGDAPPHMDYADDVQYAETCQKAQSKDIIINTIQCGNLVGTADIWQAIAQQAAGEYVAIEQSGGMQAVSTPMDEAISQLNREMAETVITYGDDRAQNIGKTKVANAMSSLPEAAAARYNYFNASNAESDHAPTAISGKEDLIAQLQQEELEESEINTEHLPDALRDLDQAELKQHIAKKSEERLAIQQRLNALLTERQSYIDTENTHLAGTGPADSFDNKVNEIIRTQAATKGIRYED